MILLKDIEDYIRRIGLDAEGSDRYLREIDVIPAINASVQWLVGVLSSVMGKDKFVEERLSDLHMTRIWQTSSLARFNIEEDLCGFSIWTITRIAVMPRVYMPLFKSAGLPPTYQLQINPYLGQSLNNKPFVRVHFSTGESLKPHQSTFRPELSYVRGGRNASRVVEEQSSENPFVPGFEHVEDFTSYGYRAYDNFNTTIGGYVLSTPKEIEVMPGGRMLVAMSFIRIPEQIPLTATDTYEIPFPMSMMELIAQKALNYIAIKQGDQTTVFNVSIQDVIQQLR